MLKKTLYVALGLFITLLFTACEPISVSVSPEGEIAFTRNEGVFVLDSKGEKISTVFWNEGMKQFPAITEWSADGSQIAYTLKEKKDAMSTDLYVAQKGKEGKKIIHIDGVVTKLQWSPDGKFLAYATGGEDSDMSVADIGLIDLSTNMSKKLVKNAADLFYWIDNTSFVTIKLDSKVADFDGRLIGAILKVTIKGEETRLTNSFVTEKKGAMHCTKDGDVLFTSLSLDTTQKADSAIVSALYTTNLKKKVSKVLDKVVTFVKYAPNNKSALLITKEKKTVDYSEKEFIRLELFNPSKKSADVLREDIKNSISVETNTLDLLPTWLNDKSILFFNMHSTYGASLQELSLFKLDVASKKVENLQPQIDSEINKIVSSKGGY